MKDVNDRIRDRIRAEYPDLCSDLRYLSKKSIHDKKIAGARILHVKKGILLAKPLAHELLTALNDPKVDLHKLPKGRFVIPQPNLIRDRVKECEKQIKYWQSKAGMNQTLHSARYLDEWVMEKRELENSL